MTPTMRAAARNGAATGRRVVARGWATPWSRDAEPGVLRTLLLCAANGCRGATSERWAEHAAFMLGMAAASLRARGRRGPARCARCGAVVVGVRAAACVCAECVPDVVRAAVMGGGRGEA